MLAFISSMCGLRRGAEETYEPVSMGVADGPSLIRLKEALENVNAMLPSPITLEDAVTSADTIKRLARGNTLARTYHICQRNLECLAKHTPNTDNPGLDAVVNAHRVNNKRVADACFASLMQLYMSVGCSDVSDTLVDGAIKMAAETELVMADVAVAEKALGLNGAQNEAQTEIIGKHEAQKRRAPNPPVASWTECTSEDQPDGPMRKSVEYATIKKPPRAIAPSPAPRMSVARDKAIKEKPEELQTATLVAV
ncbi:UL51 [anatid alphaherpesvirus 1]|uniref:UL51 n=2 Tax=anatid alphaherpesvirus 1 TaxID=104388 RepID=A7L873_9ALPH|nr:UL51 [Anatid alphaherpesvirus 1]YP_010795322.1 UL51 [Anatid alphaherpesvirus 1]AHD45928.1 UL51 [BAC cloning vector pDEV-vac]QWQ49758.1 UL51 [BAC cloning vector pDEV-CHa]ABS52577.1 tugment protein [Anatid alphaherpesvirus 1]ABU49242.1 UL51 [Anatid alphaherpesvirus 1]AEN80075.1 UL51 [Anatid alphaherpesvirus 1]